MTSSSPTTEPRPPLPLRRFRGLVALLCAAYLGLEAVYVLRLPLVMDEFQGAATLGAFATGTPFHDFTPYKVLFGYTLQLPVFLAVTDTWRAMLAVKLWMAVLASAGLALAALRLARAFDRRAVLWGLALLIATSTFLERSAELRLELPTALLGLACLVLLLEDRPAAAGAAAGLALLVSQKGALFVAAGALAVLPGDAGVRWRPRAALRYVAGAVAPCVAYLALGSVFASPLTLLRHGLAAPRRVLSATVYPIRLHYWLQTLRRNPFFYAAALAGVVTAWRGAEPPSRRLAVFTAAALLLAVAYPQPWPYFFVLLLPILFVAVTALFHRLERWPAPARRPLVALSVLLGLVLPLARVPVNLTRDSSFQRQNVELLGRLLGPGESYLAGVDLLPRRPQAVRRLRWLDRARATELAALPSAELRAVAEEIRRAPIKVVVDNYRLRALPAPLLDELARRYEHYWGNLLIYSPVFEAGDGPLELAFSARYRLRTTPGEVIWIDGRPLAPEGTVWLARGTHQRRADRPFRLRLEPELPAPRPAPPRALFPDVYDY